MKCKVFYCFGSTGDVVQSSSPVEVERSDICTKLIGQLEEDDDFLGIIDEQENMLQAMYKPEEGRYWVEIPLLDRRVSYGKYMSLEEFIDCIKRLPKTFQLQDFEDFELQEW